MKEVVLVLSHHQACNRIIKEQFSNWGVEAVYMTPDPISLLLPEVTTVIIDKEFSGNARATAKYLRALRPALRCPIIGFEISAGGGDLVSLQVAGCSFVVRPTNGFNHEAVLVAEDVGRALCAMIATIESELAAQFS